jgi:hypothetical protein
VTPGFDGDFSNLHPSYYTNQRYQKLYKGVLSGEFEKEPSTEERRETFRKDPSGVPLSNQILYEKLEYNSNQSNRKDRSKSPFEIALHRLNKDAPGDISAEGRVRMSSEDSSKLPSVKPQVQIFANHKHFESHIQSVKELKDISVELEPRSSSVWKKPLP